MQDNSNSSCPVIEHFHDFTVLEELQVQPFWVWPLMPGGLSTRGRDRLVGGLPPTLTYLAIQEPCREEDITWNHSNAAKRQAMHMGILVSLFEDFAKDVCEQLPKLKEVHLQRALEAYASGLRSELWAANEISLSEADGMRHQMCTEDDL